MKGSAVFLPEVNEIRGVISAGTEVKAVIFAGTE